MKNSAARQPTIEVSKRFNKAYSRSSACLKALIQGCVHDAVNLIRAEPQTFMHRYDRVAKLPKEGVLELKVSGAHRLLAEFDEGCLRLLSVGDHDVVEEYTKAKLYMDRLQHEPAHDRFWPDFEPEIPFFRRRPSLEFSSFGPENQPEWLYFLSLQQHEVVNEILEKQWFTDDAGPSIVLGGPGTGKTVILLNLLKDSCDLGVPAYLVVGDRLGAYIEACLPELSCDLFGHIRDIPAGTEALLLDDPGSLAELQRRLATAAASGCTRLVAAFDPCQMYEAVQDEVFAEFVGESHVDAHCLDTCYRQKENVGKQAQVAMNRVALATPFRRDDKVRAFSEAHQHLTDLANDLKFENPSGYVEIYKETSQELLALEFARIRERPLWKHWPPLLLVKESRSRDSWVEGAFENVNYEVCQLHDTERIKGLEYQHVFLFLKRETFKQLEGGFEGTGRSTYNLGRLLRIPFSRAKDSLVVFVTD